MTKYNQKTTNKRDWKPIGSQLIASLVIIWLYPLINTHSFALEHSTVKHTLILYSFKYGLSSNALMDGNSVTSRAIQRTMEKGSKHKVAFYSERMDVSTMPENRYFEEMRNVFGKRYAGKPIDLIIAVQYRALKFLIHSSLRIISKRTWSAKKR